MLFRLSTTEPISRPSFGVRNRNHDDLMDAGGLAGHTVIDHRERIVSQGAALTAGVGFGKPPWIGGDFLYSRVNFVGKPNRRPGASLGIPIEGILEILASTRIEFNRICHGRSELVPRHELSSMAPF